eukprot:86378_1
MSGALLLLLTIIVIAKSQNITCDSINENTSTCYINLINCTYYGCVVKCNSNYFNCIIYNLNEHSVLSAADLHCPSQNCLSCIINTSYAKQVNIYGYECSLLKINMLSLWSGIINAPGNGGTLILQSQSLLSMKIYSINGTQNMIINIHKEQFYTYIDASYVEGYLNYIISGFAKTYRPQIICGKQCNINC